MILVRSETFLIVPHASAPYFPELFHILIHLLVDKYISKSSCTHAIYSTEWTVPLVYQNEIKYSLHWNFLNVTVRGFVIRVRYLIWISFFLCLFLFLFFSQNFQTKCGLLELLCMVWFHTIQQHCSIGPCTIYIKAYLHEGWELTESVKST